MSLLYFSEIFRIWLYSNSFIAQYAPRLCSDTVNSNAIYNWNHDACIVHLDLHPGNMTSQVPLAVCASASSVMCSCAFQRLN